VSAGLDGFIAVENNESVNCFEATWQIGLYTVSVHDLFTNETCSQGIIFKDHLELQKSREALGRGLGRGCLPPQDRGSLGVVKHN